MTGLTNSTATSSYVYRADGMRTHKTVGTVNTEYYHDAQTPMEYAVISGTTLTATRYGLGARGIDYEEEGVGTWTNITTRSPGSFLNVGFPIYDSHGNMIATLARSGSNWYAVNNHRTYDAWGSIRSGAGTGDPKNRYCASLGHQQDDESGLIYMRARYYEVNSGRFLSEDDSRAQSNWFEYCQNQPTMCSDRDGHDSFVDSFLIAFVFALVTTVTDWLVERGLGSRSFTGLKLATFGGATIVFQAMFDAIFEEAASLGVEEGPGKSMFEKVGSSISKGILLGGSLGMVAMAYEGWEQAKIEAELIYIDCSDDL